MWRENVALCHATVSAEEWKESFHAAIEACAHEALSVIYLLSGSVEESHEHCLTARVLAEGLAKHTDTLPGMFKNSPLLREAWEDGRNWLAECQCEAERERAAALAKAQVTVRIDRGNWADLHLPTPEEALLTLLAGKTLETNGHSVVYDAGDGITWYTNAYGVDGALCSKPDLKAVTTFLTDMAYGVDYGPVPY